MRVIFKGKTKMYKCVGYKQRGCWDYVRVEVWSSNKEINLLQKNFWNLIFELFMS